MSGMPPPFAEFVQPFQVEALGVRGRLVRLGNGVAAIADAERYPDDVAELLAATTALAAALASGLKYDGVFTLQAQGNGPVSLLLADITSDGDMRGYANFDADAVAAADASMGMVPRLLGAGHLAFTVDQGPDTDRYQGITELTGATLADCAQTYFRDSEQLETAIILDSGRDEAGGLQAGAFLVQKMPDEDNLGDHWEDPTEPWREAAVLTSTLKAAELMDASLPPSELLFRLFHERGVRVFDTRPLRHACRCSRERVTATLASFPRAEIVAMQVDGNVVVTCEFCGHDYVFDETGLEALFA